MRKIASRFLVSMIAGQAWAEEFTPVRLGRMESAYETLVLLFQSKLFLMIKI